MKYIVNYFEIILFHVKKRNFKIYYKFIIKLNKKYDRNIL